jgi:hypothetical protein
VAIFAPGEPRGVPLLWSRAVASTDGTLGDLDRRSPLAGLAMESPFCVFKSADADS